MKRWIKTVATRARTMRPGLMVVPQNGVQLLDDKKYIELIDGIGVEDLYAVGDDAQEV